MEKVGNTNYLGLILKSIAASFPVVASVSAAITELESDIALDTIKTFCNELDIELKNKSDKIESLSLEVNFLKEVVKAYSLTDSIERRSILVKIISEHISEQDSSKSRILDYHFLYVSKLCGIHHLKILKNLSIKNKKFQTLLAYSDFDSSIENDTEIFLIALFDLEKHLLISSHQPAHSSLLYKFNPKKNVMSNYSNRVYQITELGKSFIKFSRNVI